MPGFCQFATGVYLFVGLTWFNVFGGTAPLYIADFAFSVYGIHWFAMAHRRFIGASNQPDAWMAIAFALVSTWGRTMAGSRSCSWAALELSHRNPGEIPGFGVAGTADGLRQLLTGIWLMYLTYATAFNLALGAHCWL